VICLGDPAQGGTRLVNSSDDIANVSRLRRERFCRRVAWDGPSAGVEAGSLYARRPVHNVRSAMSAAAGVVPWRVLVVIRYHARAARIQNARAIFTDPQACAARAE
jgi:hypothetical protein